MKANEDVVVLPILAGLVEKHNVKMSRIDDSFMDNVGYRLEFPNGMSVNTMWSGLELIQNQGINLHDLIACRLDEAMDNCSRHIRTSG